jgi:hypothetical protein
MTGTVVSGLSDADFNDLAKSFKEADSVELKYTVAEAEHRKTLASLKMDTLDAQIRHVFFFDTPDLTLDSHGVVVRARRVHGRDDDSVVKLRPVVPAELPKALRTSPDFGVEIDAMPGSFVCSAALKRFLPDAPVKAAVAGEAPIRKLFSKAQRTLFAEHAPSGVTMDDLSIFGPIFVLKLKDVPEGFARKLVAELWLYPDNRWILELSTKCPPNEAFQVAAEARAFIIDHGVELGDQRTKTRTALEFFAQRFKMEDTTQA